jgi:hypothetical protein
VSLVAIAIGVYATPVSASPTMIRLGYTDCASCHLSPQGAGLLIAYGKGIDEAQSLRVREVTPNDTGRWLIDGRIVAATRLPAGSTVSATLRSAMRINERHRVTYYMALENMVTGTKVVVPKALWEYRVKPGVEIAAGRDLLPTGIGLPDAQTFVRDPRDEKNPTQVKAFLWNKRWQVAPYLFGPGGGVDQYGGGVVGGVDVAHGHAIVGLSTRLATGDRQSIGAFTRLGVGRWGILAEQDLRAHNGHTQFFFATREWLVLSLAAEHVTWRIHTYRLTPAVQARLTSRLTLIVSARDVFSRPHTWSQSLNAQIAMKSVQ